MAPIRRHPWQVSLLLTILCYVVLHSLHNRRNELSSSAASRPPRSVMRPSDFAQHERQWRPSDDNFPHPLEPAGPGTMRDMREEKFYLGGVATVQPWDESLPPALAVYDPYPDYNTREWSKEWKGKFKACEGPRGRALDRRSAEDMVRAYPGVQEGFPYPKYGSYEALGLDGYTCATRASRLSAYGYSEDSSDSTSNPDAVPWDTVNWGTLQSQCFEHNANRYYKPRKTPRPSILPLNPIQSDPPPDEDQGQSSPTPKKRSAVILRGWHDMVWTENLKQHVRSLIMELSLHSGGEYEVFLLTHVKDNDLLLYATDEGKIQELKERFIPPEFWDITVLFNERTLQSWYPKVDEHRPVYQYPQPLQIFSTVFPDFHYYWQFELDARFTGHSYPFLERASDFAKQQPRKYLWERNAYFYIPGAHGNWDEFKHMVDESLRTKNDATVWGPAPPFDWIKPVGPEPPVPSPKNDNYEWGVGEDADLITFLPIFDPVETTWVFWDKLWNLPLEETTRRTSPVMMGRYSHRLLQLMHNAQIDEGVALVSEMTPSSFALWHGLKAVYAPHPIYADGKWTPKELNGIVNKAAGGPAKINGGKDSFWNWDHKLDHIVYRMSYMFTGQPGEDFYRRWLGYRVDPGQYTDGSRHQDAWGLNWYDGGDLREDLYGPLCLPSMLLHPVKNTELKKGPDMAVPV
ncbi:DUF3405 domain-containing protein [Aspergillus mulundensis]|uniref:Uncharacterized protein n=1 Tax=Aspergillus mulundensis TaxID=1810919 RepID=A0A3D8R4W6_9EURO|nr:Uncharacterized protein DSM5745_08614 [Aspergillus mulundensis]RDW68854.1 Uncharacterized protein DSM5745_08614 [Aspergillus mulundensis]